MSLIVGSSKSFVKSFQSPPHHSATEAPLSLLWEGAKVGNIQKALLSSSSVVYQTSGGVWKRSSMPNSTNLQKLLLESLTAGGCTDIRSLPESLWTQLATPVLTVLPFVYLYFLYRLVRHSTGSDDKARTYDNLDTRTTLDDVAGIDPVVREVAEVVQYLRQPDTYDRVGARPPRGILLYGPPGSGKTLLARAVAGQADCDCFMACSGSDFVDTYVGRGASRIRKLFHTARTQAKKQHYEKKKRKKKSTTITKQPSAIVFIDEIDALAKSRASSNTLGSSDEREQTLNQLLTELDGFCPNDDVTLILIAATNRADVLDPALLRRLDRQVAVPLPNALGRQAIFCVHARKINCNADEIDWQYLASDAMTENFSGADIANAVNEAALIAVRQRGEVVLQHHLIQAVHKLQGMKGNLYSKGNALLSNFVLR